MQRILGRVDRWVTSGFLVLVMLAACGCGRAISRPNWDSPAPSVVDIDGTVPVVQLGVPRATANAAGDVDSTDVTRSGPAGVPVSRPASAADRVEPLPTTRRRLEAVVRQGVEPLDLTPVPPPPPLPRSIPVVDPNALVRPVVAERPSETSPVPVRTPVEARPVRLDTIAEPLPDVERWVDLPPVAIPAAVERSSGIGWAWSLAALVVAAVSVIAIRRRRRSVWMAGD